MSCPLSANSCSSEERQKRLTQSQRHTGYDGDSGTQTDTRYVYSEKQQQKTHSFGNSDSEYRFEWVFKKKHMKIFIYH